MKSFRIWLIVLLAFVLPLRGALAAAMLCPAGESGVHVAAPVAEHSHDGHHSHDTGEAAYGQDHLAGTDTCNLCSACCSVPGMPAGTVAVMPPQFVQATFPDIAAPPPRFATDGQERPPRSI